MEGDCSTTPPPCCCPSSALLPPSLPALFLDSMSAYPSPLHSSPAGVQQLLELQRARARARDPASATPFPLCFLPPSGGFSNCAELSPSALLLPSALRLPVSAANESQGGGGGGGGGEEAERQFHPPWWPAESPSAPSMTAAYHPHCTAPPLYPAQRGYPHDYPPAPYPSADALPFPSFAVAPSSSPLFSPDASFFLLPPLSPSTLSLPPPALDAFHPLLRWTWSDGDGGAGGCDEWSFALLLQQAESSGAAQGLWFDADAGHMDDGRGWLWSEEGGADGLVGAGGNHGDVPMMGQQLPLQWGTWGTMAAPLECGEGIGKDKEWGSSGHVRLARTPAAASAPPCAARTDAICADTLRRLPLFPVCAGSGEGSGPSPWWSAVGRGDLSVPPPPLRRRVEPSFSAHRSTPGLLLRCRQRDFQDGAVQDARSPSRMRLRVSGAPTPSPLCTHRSMHLRSSPAPSLCLWPPLCCSTGVQRAVSVRSRAR